MCEIKDRVAIQWRKRACWWRAHFQRCWSHR